jgi:GNAT superfamily N-acetyltransferase
VHIRDARPGEEEALGELHRRASYVWEEDRVHLDAHPDALGVAAADIAAGRVRVAAGEDGALLGFALVRDVASGVRELDDLMVDPSVMRRGIGSRLVEDAVERAARDAYRELTVVAHPRTHAFYERLGFLVGEPAETRFGPAVRLRRGLG